MRYVTFLTTLLMLTVSSAGQTPTPSSIWDQLKAKRQSLGTVHQEFESIHRSTTQKDSQESIRSIVVELSDTRWIERQSSGSGTDVTLFNGVDVFTFEEGGAEFVRTKPDKKTVPLSNPYSPEVELSKLKQIEERPCNVPGAGPLCVFLEGPIKKTPSDGPAVMDNGVAQFLFDAQNGLLLYSRKVRLMQYDKTSYTSETTLRLMSTRLGKLDSDRSFELPSADMREVKKLTEWDIAKIKKELTGKPAPDLLVRDLTKKEIRLADYRGKVVLLDFWTTWCPPCRADGPALETLHKKFSDDLAIIAISVSEQRNVVETYLKTHPYSFPIVLTTENNMPRPYQISWFPTYIVIGRDGVVVTSASDEQGVGKFEGLLKKAGLKND
jgi:thiol-disulfide isomerase/thioredoxin